MSSTSPTPTRPLRGRAALLAALGPLVGCASYPERTAGALHDFQRGHLQPALEAFADPDTTGSPFLAGAEAGTVALAAGDWDAALVHFSRAAAEVEELEGRALIGAERLGDTLASWAVNDTTRAYQGEGFERVYVHASLALAYLAKGRLDDVYVEARRANRLLEVEEELYETSYAAGGIGHWISAVAYELLGEPDEAYIDYERMVEKGVGTELAGRALVRLARQLGREEDARGWEERFGPDVERPPGAASIVLVAGVGLGPYKTETRLALPTRDGFFTLAAPSYRTRPQAVTGLRLGLVGGATVRADVVESASQVATENLQDRVAWITAKSAARGILKRQLTKELDDRFGIGGRIFGDLFALATERADLRAWQTLPDSWQACRLFVPPGVHSVRLDAIGGETRDLGTYELEAGETLVVLARSVGPRLHAHVVGGGLATARGAGLPDAGAAPAERSYMLSPRGGERP